MQPQERHLDDRGNFSAQAPEDVLEPEDKRNGHVACESHQGV